MSVIILNTAVTRCHNNNSVSLLLLLLLLFQIILCDWMTFGFRVSILNHHHQYNFQRCSTTTTITSIQRRMKMETLWNHDDNYDSQKRRLLIFGYGNVGQEVVNVLSSSDLSIHDETLFSHDKENFFQEIYATVKPNTHPPSLHNNNNEKTKIQFLSFDENHPEEIIQLIQQKQMTHVLMTIPPILLQQQQQHQNQTTNNETLCYKDVLLDHHQELLKSITTTTTTIQWFGYISTTGVYGNHNNDWVNESSITKCQPSSKAFVYLTIESRYQQLLLQKQIQQLVIFRCSGLYGNQFSALHTQQRNNNLLTNNNHHNDTNDNDKKRKNIPSKNDTTTINYTSRIHLKDVARAIVASILTNHRIIHSLNHNNNKEKQKDYEKTTETNNHIVEKNHEYYHTHDDCLEIYNLADNEPTPRHVVMSYSANLLSLHQNNTDSSLPTNECYNHNNNTNNYDTKISKRRPQLSERSKRRTQERKRVCNKKLLHLLKSFGGIMYPSYREGLTSIYNSKENNFQSKS